MNFDVVDTNNTSVGSVELDESIFGAVVRNDLFWEVVKMQLAGRRAGTHSTKTVTEVRGSGAKPYRQKGTGRARHGSKRAMNMRGGGIVFGPKPRDYSYKLPKKMVKAALRCALSLRAQESMLHIVRGWAPEKPSTKDAAKVLQGFSADKALVVGTVEEVNLGKSVRNLPKAKFLPANALNVYDILKYDHLFISEGALTEITEKLHTELSRKERELRAAQAGGAEAQA